MIQLETIGRHKGSLTISDLNKAPEEIVSFVIREKILVCDRGRAYLNCGTHYQIINSDELPDLICDLIQPEQVTLIKTQRIDEACKRLLRHPSIRFNMEAERKRTEHLVNVRNGVYDIATGQFSEDRGDAKFDYILDFEYKARVVIQQARSFMAFVESSLGAVYLPCLLRILGYCISTLTKARKAFLLLGKGMTGKSTLLELIETVVGVAFCSHVPFHSIGNIHSRAEYLGKRINISRDNSDQPMKSEDAFKNVVSCEMTTGRRPYENAVDFVPRLKLIFASNVDLHFAHPDDAVFDRILVIPFTKDIPPEKRDLNLLNKMLADRDIIFSAALNMLPDLVKSGYDFGEPDASKEIIKSYRAALPLHTIHDFIDECCTLDENGTVSSLFMYERYVQWCKDNGFQPESDKKFKSPVLSFSTSISISKVYHEGKRVNGFKGISLRQPGAQVSEN